MKHKDIVQHILEAVLKICKFSKRFRVLIVSADLTSEWGSTRLRLHIPAAEGEDEHDDDLIPDCHGCLECN